MAKVSSQTSSKPAIEGSSKKALRKIETPKEVQAIGQDLGKKAGVQLSEVRTSVLLDVYSQCQAGDTEMPGTSGFILGISPGLNLKVGQADPTTETRAKPREHKCGRLIVGTPWGRRLE